jgi:hypothetical protein
VRRNKKTGGVLSRPARHVRGIAVFAGLVSLPGAGTSHKENPGAGKGRRFPGRASSGRPMPDTR